MKILLATDGSESSGVAVREVGERPWPAGTEVRVVTVDPPLGEPIFGEETGVFSAFDEFVHAQRVAAQRRLDAAAAAVRQMAPNLTVSQAVLEGMPKAAILEEARRWGADLVVVGSHGRGAVKSLFLGSVSLAVVLGAPCSVLVARARDDDARA